MVRVVEGWIRCWKPRMVTNIRWRALTESDCEKIEDSRLRTSRTEEICTCLFYTTRSPTATRRVPHIPSRNWLFAFHQVIPTSLYNATKFQKRTRAALTCSFECHVLSALYHLTFILEDKDVK